MGKVNYHGIELDLDDPVLLLVLITALREHGFRVEPPTPRYGYVGAAPGVILKEDSKEVR
mgnify:CR=1 FL=1